MGGPLAVSVSERLRRENPEADVATISLSGWLNLVNQEQLEYTALNRPGKKRSPASVESVEYYNDSVLPGLTEESKRLTRTVRGRADPTVPLQAMSIPGVQEYTVPSNGHVGGIARGALLVPAILDDIYTKTPLSPTGLNN